MATVITTPAERPATAPVQHVDMLIVGAGLSGIGAAYHLQAEQPGRTYVILEGRDAMGGTWDLFRYPGIRSDSDLHTYGYAFKPWTDDKALADGDAILEYIHETARENRIDRHIRYGHRVLRASWSSEDARWTVEATRTDTGETVLFTANWLFSAGGYYRYDEGFTPQFEGRDRFAGQRPVAVVRHQDGAAVAHAARERRRETAARPRVVLRPRALGHPRRVRRRPDRRRRRARARA